MMRKPPALSFAVLASIAVLAPPSAWAATVVVPDDFATVQAAVDAVQGTPDPVVRIDSDATFVETVIANLSVSIEAGAGFTPTIQGAGVSCGFSGGCTVGFNPNGVTDTAFALRGIRLLPEAGANTSDHSIQVFNQSDRTATVDLHGLVIEDPESSGAGAVNIRVSSLNAGSNVVTVTGSSISLGGSPGFGTTAFTMLEDGSLTITGVDLAMTGSSGDAFDVRGSGATPIAFSLTDSTFTIDAPAGPFTSEIGRLLLDIDAVIARNVFHLQSAAEGSVSGIGMGSGFNGVFSSSLILDANRFLGSGDGVGAALSVFPFEDETVTVLATNNVTQGLGTGFSFNPQSGDPGGVVEATLTNNTVHASEGDAVSIGGLAGTSITLDLVNNLLTQNGGCGIDVTASGALALNADFNGLFANAGGDYCGLSAGANDIVADPLYTPDLHLRVGSPMLDSGDNGAPGITPTDADGEARIQNGIVDRGAFEGEVALAEDIPTVGGVGMLVLTLALAGAALLTLRRLPAIG